MASGIKIYSTDNHLEFIAGSLESAYPHQFYKNANIANCVLRENSTVAGKQGQNNPQLGQVDSFSGVSTQTNFGPAPRSRLDRLYFHAFVRET